MIAERVARRIRVVHVVQNLNYGGMERMLAELLRAADHERFEYHVLALQYLGRFAEGLPRHVGLHTVGAMSRWSMIRPTKLARWLRSLRPDVVHTHSGVWFKASLAAQRVTGVRVVHTEHGRAHPDPWVARILDRAASRRTDAVVAVSDALAKQLVETVGVDPKRVRVIPNGVDVQEFSPVGPGHERAAVPGVEPNAPIVGSIGRLEEVKGYDVMLRAFARVRRSWMQDPQPVLVLAGDGTERQRLCEMAEQMGVNQAVRFLGWRDDISNLLRSFTIFTLSSRSEGTSVSLLEAMSTGLCPVVTDVGGNRSVLGERLRHLLVPPEDADALASAWIRVLTDEAGRTRDAVLARQEVAARYSLGATIKAYEKLYREAGADANADRIAVAGNR